MSSMICGTLPPSAPHRPAQQGQRPPCRRNNGHVNNAQQARHQRPRLQEEPVNTLLRRPASTSTDALDTDEEHVNKKLQRTVNNLVQELDDLHVGTATVEPPQFSADNPLTMRNNKHVNNLSKNSTKTSIICGTGAPRPAPRRCTQRACQHTCPRTGQPHVEGNAHLHNFLHCFDDYENCNSEDLVDDTASPQPPSLPPRNPLLGLLGAQYLLCGPNTTHNTHTTQHTNTGASRAQSASAGLWAASLLHQPSGPTRDGTWLATEPPRQRQEGAPWQGC